MGRLVAPVLASAALAVVPAATASFPSSDACTISRQTSWAGSRYGWELRSAATGVGCAGRLYGTNDGGRTWRLVYREPSGPIGAILRTSARSGVIFPVRWQASRAKARWTRDGGRSWRRSAEIGPRGADEFAVAGRGTRLFWAGAGGLHRVTGWPSGPLRSRAVWTSSRGRRILRTGGTPWVPLELVPEGAATIVSDGTEPARRLWVLLHRRGQNRLVQLPGATPALAAIDADALDTEAGMQVRASWPRLTVCSWATRWGRRPGEFAIQVGFVVWRSPDGGRTWTVDGLPSLGFGCPV